jgi:hypothetical protein
MPAQQNHSEYTLTTFLTEQRNFFTAQFPEHAPYFLKALDESTTQSPITRKNTDQETLVREIGAEEEQQILQKLKELVTFPPKQTEEEKLYLEQQLADLLDLSLVSEISSYTLPHSLVTIQHHQGWKENQRDADVSSTRSIFGWSQQRVEFAIGLPLHLTPAWINDPIQAREWYKHARVVLINPMENCAVICKIVDVYLGPLTQYQAVATKAVLQAGKVWSRNSQGKMLIFFLDESTPTQLGPLELTREGEK